MYVGRPCPSDYVRVETEDGVSGLSFQVEHSSTPTGSGIQIEGRQFGVHPRRMKLLSPTRTDFCRERLSVQLLYQPLGVTNLG